MQTLAVFQSLWAMERRHPLLPERSMDENFRMIAGAGYQGVCLDPSVAEIDAMADLKPLFLRHGLGCMINAFPFSVEELNPLLKLAVELQARVVNVIGGVMPVDPRDAIPVIRRWMDDARVVGLPLLFETHRDSLLNDLYYTLPLLDAVPEMRLCADLSHFVLDRELRLPLRPHDAYYFNRIIDRADCFQGRVANREQIQVQIEFPQHQVWVDQFKTWWREGMRRWRRRSAADAELIFLCELGPPPYAMTDRNGEELSDRWAEAAIIRGWVEQIFGELN